MRHLLLLPLLLLLASCAFLQSKDADEAPVKLIDDPIVRKALYEDLKDDLLVQNAVANHDVAVIAIDNDYTSQTAALVRPDAAYDKKLEALVVARDQKLEAAKTTCLAALHRAADVRQSLHKPAAAAAIALLADRLAKSPDNDRFTINDYPISH